LVKRLGRVDYEPTWQAMQSFTATRQPETPGRTVDRRTSAGLHARPGRQAGTLLQDIGIPIVKIDRGGQVTYHGPGQVVIYLLLDLSRLKIKVRELVTAIEQAVIDFLAATASPPNGTTVRPAFMSARPKSPHSACASEWLQLPRPVTQCRYGSFPICRDQSLRLCWPESHPDQGSQHCRSPPFEAGEQLSQHLLQQLDKQHG
jgi:lipoyl(octanoyl) transferase